jgi:hypothetical protein
MTTDHRIIRHRALVGRGTVVSSCKAVPLLSLSPRGLPDSVSSGLIKDAVSFAQHHNADTLHSAHGFPGSPDHPNRASEGDTAKVLATRKSSCRAVQISGLAAAPQPTPPTATTNAYAKQQQPQLLQLRVDKERRGPVAGRSR